MTVAECPEGKNLMDLKIEAIITAYDDLSELVLNSGHIR
jgi:hypothetical protein